MKDLSQIVQPLLAWYKKYKRDLPWRKNTQPYPVWISEIMLQQTRVEAVKPYYTRFMQRLQDIQSLAAVSEEELLKLWEGLGYYSRARNLKKAAIQIMENFQGVFPSKKEDILSLAGIGEYTAGAIASICFQQKTPAVDGNVIRVVSRLCREELSDKGKISEMLEKIYPSESGDFTQSLMELGALICIPSSSPRCEECPLRELCDAYHFGEQANFPKPKEKLDKKKQWLTVLVLQSQDWIAIQKREEKGLLQNLWEFPNLAKHLTLDEAQKVVQKWGMEIMDLQVGKRKTHVFTHRIWEMCSYVITIKNRSPEFVWVKKSQLQRDIPLPTAFKGFI